MVYSESGGVTKTATAVSLAYIAAASGKRVLVIDLDPRAATSQWFNVEPSEPGLDVSAILGSRDPRGWAEELAVQTTWHERLSVIPSDRGVSSQESDRADHAELRLRAALEGVTADLVIIDCPNRQGGPLILNALTAADSVVYAAAASSDGVSGFLGAQQSVERFKAARRAIGAPDTTPEELGIVVGAVKETVMSRAAVHSIDQLRASGLLLEPLVPNRSVVDEVRYSHEWYGDYRKGAPVLDAYTKLAQKVIR